jgi:hypothetical protein
MKPPISERNPVTFDSQDAAGGPNPGAADTEYPPGNPDFPGRRGGIGAERGETAKRALRAIEDFFSKPIPGRGPADGRTGGGSASSGGLAQRGGGPGRGATSLQSRKPGYRLPQRYPAFLAQVNDE